MTVNKIPRPHHVVIAGGGVAGLEALLALEDMARDAVDVTLLSDEPEFRYRPLSVAEPFGGDEVRTYSSADIAAGHGAEFRLGSVMGVEPDRHVVRLRDHSELAYDSLILAVGAEREPAFTQALTFVDQRNTLGVQAVIGRLERGEITRLAFIVPPGIVWPFPLYELALMTGAFVAERRLDAELSLCTPAAAPLALFGRPASTAMAEMLAERGIKVHAGYRPRPVSPNRVMLDPDGPALEADRIISIPRMFGPRITGLPRDPDRFIPVDAHGRVEGLRDVHAVGDCANFPVKQGGLAAQQAVAAVETIATALGTRERADTFRPVLRGKLLTGKAPTFVEARMGAAGAITEALAHQALWWPPAKIAGRYLAPLLEEIDTAEVLAPPGGVNVEEPLEPAQPSIAATMPR